MYDANGIARIHASAFNAHDLDSFANQVATGARLLRDGRLVAEGRQKVMAGIDAEHRPGEYMQVRHLDGEPVLAECHADRDHPEIDAVVRLHHVGDFVDEVSIEHDPALIGRLQD